MGQECHVASLGIVVPCCCLHCYDWGRPRFFQLPLEGMSQKGYDSLVSMVSADSFAPGAWFLLVYHKRTPVRCVIIAPTVIMDGYPVLGNG